jgi:hypothetical protein
VAGQFTVDGDELLQMSTHASHLYYAMQPHTLSAGVLDGRGGHPLVVSQYNHFVSHWSDGMWKLRDQLDQLAQHLSDAGLAYLGAEREITKAAKGGGE